MTEHTPIGYFIFNKHTILLHDVNNKVNYRQFFSHLKLFLNFFPPKCGLGGSMCSDYILLAVLVPKLAFPPVSLQLRLLSFSH